MLTELKAKQFDCFINYALEKISVDVDKFKEFFESLPPDPYLQGNYRLRRLSRFQVAGDRLIKLEHDCLFQSKQYNPLLGNLKREYLELEQEMIELKEFKNLVFEFFEFCKRCSTPNEIGVHQIRITSSHQQIGSPAPEGVHRDGVDLVGIFCVNREKIAGGATHLYTAKNDQPVFQKILEPGELLVFNDHQFFHFTTPIQAISSFKEGSRDVFVFTSPGLPSPNHSK